jgi:hypothetical protein
MSKAKITEATKQYLSARQAVEVAQQALAQAEAIMKQSFSQNGVDFNIVDDQKVMIVKSDRAKYSVEALKGLVSDKLFKKITKVEVDGKKFKSAVELGDIKSDIAEAVTTFTSVEAVRVYDLSKATEEATAQNARKVA